MLALVPAAGHRVSTCGARSRRFSPATPVGNVTPLGLLASEPTKVLLTRHHLATRGAVASLAVENLVYAGSVVAMVGIGLIVLAINVEMPPCGKRRSSAPLPSWSEEARPRFA
jgi:hypothetical protein